MSNEQQIEKLKNEIPELKSVSTNDIVAFIKSLALHGHQKRPT